MASRPTTLNEALELREQDNITFLPRYTLKIGMRDSIVVHADAETSEGMLVINASGLNIRIFLDRQETQDFAAALSMDLEHLLVESFRLRSVAISKDYADRKFRNVRSLPTSDVTRFSHALESFRWANRRVLIPAIRTRLKAGAIQ